MSLPGWASVAAKFRCGCIGGWCERGQRDRFTARSIARMLSNLRKPICSVVFGSHVRCNVAVPEAGAPIWLWTGFRNVAVPEGGAPVWLWNGFRDVAVPEAGAPIWLWNGFRNVAMPEAGAPMWTFHVIEDEAVLGH